MGILEKKLFIDSQKYISVFKAIELIAKCTKEDLKTVVKYLAKVEIETYLDSYIKTKADAYYPSENYFSGAYQATSEIIVTLFSIKYLKNDYELNSFNYPELCKYEDYYWLKTDFFTCPIIQEINIQEDNLSIDLITNNTTPLFYLNDIFSVVEAACLLSGDDPTYISISLNDTNFEQNHLLFNEAFNFINSAIAAKKLSTPITSQDLKIYLQSKRRIIDGFNDAIIEDNFSNFDESYLDSKIDIYTDYQFWYDVEPYRLDELENQNTPVANQTELEKQIKDLKSEIKTLKQVSQFNEALIDNNLKHIDSLDAKNWALLEQLKQLKEQLQTNQTFDELTPDQEILSAKTRNKVGVLIAVLCELNEMNITTPYGDANTVILEKAGQLRSPLGKDFVAKWLKLAQENIE